MASRDARHLKPSIAIPNSTTLVSTTTVLFGRVSDSTTLSAVGLYRAIFDERASTLEQYLQMAREFRATRNLTYRGSMCTTVRGG